MNLLEAYAHVMGIVGKLQQQGHIIEVTPRKDPFPHVEDQLSNDLWCTITFHVEDYKLADTAFYLAAGFAAMGISFDMGGDEKSRDWQIDHSFQSTGKFNEEKVDWIEALEEDLERLRKAQSGFTSEEEIRCDLCRHEFFIPDPEFIDKAKCPNCSNTTTFEIIY